MFRGRLRTALPAIFFLLLGSSVQAAEIEPLANRFVLPAHRTPAVTCELWNHGDTIAAFYSQIAAGERYAALFDPANCTATPQFPFEVRVIWLTLYTFVGANWPAKVEVEIWSVTGGVACKGPGGLLYSEAKTLDQATYSLPNLGKITLAQSVCVDGPFFVAIRYTGQSIAPYPSVMFDSRMPADSCLNWGYGPTTNWDNWWHFWNPPIPGNIILWVDGETGSSTCTSTPCCNGLSGNIDCDQTDLVDISDLSRLIDYLYISFQPLCCASEANVDVDPGVDIGDLSRLIDYLYITFNPIGQCQ
jgi:hypothetical protein